MSHSSSRHSRPSRAVRVACAPILAVLLIPLLVTSPAGAAPAPLFTEDALAIRVDQTALEGSILEEIEAEAQALIDDLIYDGAVEDAPLDDYLWLTASSAVELALDFLEPDSGRPQGGVTLHADIRDIEIEYRADPIWPFSDCSIFVRPDDATIDVTARVEGSNLPDTPLVVEPAEAEWDDSPSVGFTGICWVYLIDDLLEALWNALIGNHPESTASQIEALIDGMAQDLVDDVWDEYVRPVVDEFSVLNITIATIETDDFGLKVTADLDATAGLTIPGLGGPFNVSAAEESGSTSNVHDLLSQRGEVIVSIHPNVVNQFLNTLNQLQGGTLTTIAIDGVTAEELLLPPAMRAMYNDNQWVVNVAVQQAYYVQPTGPGGAPQLVLPQLRVQFRHPQSFFGTRPVATFLGLATGIDLITEQRTMADAWGPALVAGDDVAVGLTLLTGATLTNPAVVTWDPDPGELLPWVKEAVTDFNGELVVPSLSLAPVIIAGHRIDVCETCDRYPGDDRYTETFVVS